MNIFMRFSLLVLVLFSGIVGAQELKIATLAPDGSSWMETLRDAAERVRERTDGQVRIRFYPGGVMGDAATVQRRIRLGQLHGGTFTVGELASVAPASNLYSLPFQFDNAQELAALREEFDPLILAALHEGGMVAPAISNGGFAYLFSRQRVDSAEDVSSAFKVWVPENDPLSRRTLERIGASAVAMGLSEVYTGLQTGTINTFANTLSGAIILQWHTRARYVLDLPVIITAGTLAVERKAFERLEPAHGEIWKEEFAAALHHQEQQSARENEDARKALVGQGVEFVQPDPADVEQWQRIADEVIDEMTSSGEFRVPGLKRLRTRLAEIRAMQQ